MTTKKTRTRIEIKHISEVDIKDLTREILEQFYALTSARDTANSRLVTAQADNKALREALARAHDSLNSIQKITGK